ncbi:Rv3654c family TadE-like protein [Streptomyces sp. SID13031]|uniref:Rv3654c family TadE-like protein n=1 Tax=Streptomyces sp. SID13031 TaxID=2706046 RepID=UPI0013CB2C22|nr:Rv3654c family TadE-like protein [Streptomyces sp. SID13031]NEA35610.1 flp pilus-assembly TadE/G-like family protein [Streptomyces sp. SID13031]
MADRTDRGSATLLALGIAAVLLGGCLVGVLWAAVSVGHHRVDAAADLVALSAAQAQQSNPADACPTAARIADTHRVELKTCRTEGEAVSVAVTLRLHLGVLGTPLLTGEARAGPIGGGDWPGDG